MSDVISAMQTFAQESIKPIADQIDDIGEFPVTLLPTLAKAGFLRACLPVTAGGLGLSAREQGIFVEYAGRYCANIKNIFLVNIAMVGGAICAFGDRQQINTWVQPLQQGMALGAFCLTEPDVGSDSAAIQTTFHPVSGGYQLNGVKKWITLGGIADFYLIAAQCNGQVETFLIEANRTGIERKPITHLLCNRASALAEIRLNRVFVPQANRLAASEQSGHSVVSTILDIGRYHSAWGAVALAGACLEEMVSYARRRRQFGKKLREHQLIQKMIADASCQLCAARALATQAGDARMQSSADAHHLSTTAKYFASKMVVTVANDALQLHGARGFSNEHPVARYYREAKAFEVIEGTSEILAQWIAKVTLQRGY